MTKFDAVTVTAPVNTALAGLLNLVDQSKLTEAQRVEFDKHNDVLRYAVVLLGETLGSLRQIEAKMAHASDDVVRRMAEIAQINKGK